MLDRLLDVALLLRRQPREFAGEDFPRFGDVAVEGFGFNEPGFRDFLFVRFFCHVVLF